MYVAHVLSVGLRPRLGLLPGRCGNCFFFRPSLLLVGPLLPFLGEKFFPRLRLVASAAGDVGAVGTRAHI
jgi:hypothetical protein